MKPWHGLEEESVSQREFSHSSDMRPPCSTDWSQPDRTQWGGGGVSVMGRTSFEKGSSVV